MEFDERYYVDRFTPVLSYEDMAENKDFWIQGNQIFFPDERTLERANNAMLGYNKSLRRSAMRAGMKSLYYQDLTGLRAIKTETS